VRDSMKRLVVGLGLCLGFSGVGFGSESSKVTQLKLKFEQELYRQSKARGEWNSEVMYFFSCYSNLSIDFALKACGVDELPAKFTECVNSQDPNYLTEVVVPKCSFNAPIYAAKIYSKFFYRD